MRSDSGWVISCEAAFSDVETSVGLVRPMPPSLAGRESKLRSRLLGACLPLRAGMRRVEIMSSRGCKKLLMFGMVRASCVHLLVKPCVKAANAE